MKNILFLILNLFCVVCFSQQNPTIKKKETSVPAVKIPVTTINKGVFVMTKTACPRCEETLLYLKKNKIVFTQLKYDSAEDRAKIWVLIKEDKSLPKNITFPIIVINGKLSHSHVDLTKFLKTIK
jgi:glutaredoxin